MSQLPFFTWHNILCAAVIGAVGAVGAACSARRVFMPAVSPSHCSTLNHHVCASSPYTTIFVTHSNTVCVRRVFRVLVKCFSGEKVWCAVLVCEAPSTVRAARQLHSRRRRRRLLRSQRQQMAALDFVNFFL